MSELSKKRAEYEDELLDILEDNSPVSRSSHSSLKDWRELSELSSDDIDSSYDIDSESDSEDEMKPEPSRRLSRREMTFHRWSDFKNKFKKARENRTVINIDMRIKRVKGSSNAVLRCRGDDETLQTCGMQLIQEIDDSKKMAFEKSSQRRSHWKGHFKCRKWSSMRQMSDVCNSKETRTGYVGFEEIENQHESGHYCSGHVFLWVYKNYFRISWLDRNHKLGWSIYQEDCFLRRMNIDPSDRDDWFIDKSIADLSYEARRLLTRPLLKKRQNYHLNPSKDLHYLTTLTDDGRYDTQFTQDFLSHDGYVGYMLYNQRFSMETQHVARELMFDSTQSITKTSVEIFSLMISYEGIPWTCAVLFLGRGENTTEEGKIRILEQFLSLATKTFTQLKLIVTHCNRVAIRAIRNALPKVKIQICLTDVENSVRKAHRRHKDSTRDWTTSYQPADVEKYFENSSVKFEPCFGSNKENRTGLHATEECDCQAKDMPRLSTKERTNEYRLELLDLLLYHVKINVEIPKMTGNGVWTPEEIHRFAVQEMYQFCYQKKDAELWAYMFNTWYTPSRWNLISCASMRHRPSTWSLNTLRTNLMQLKKSRPISQPVSIAELILDILLRRYGKTGWYLWRLLDRKRRDFFDKTTAPKWRVNFGKEWLDCLEKGQSVTSDEMKKFGTDPMRVVCSCKKYVTSPSFLCEHLIPGFERPDRYGMLQLRFNVERRHTAPYLKDDVIKLKRDYATVEENAGNSNTTVIFAEAQMTAGDDNFNDDSLISWRNDLIDGDELEGPPFKDSTEKIDKHEMEFIRELNDLIPKWRNREFDNFGWKKGADFLTDEEPASEEEEESATEEESESEEEEVRHDAPWRTAEPLKLPGQSKIMQPVVGVRSMKITEPSKVAGKVKETQSYNVVASKSTPISNASRTFLRDRYADVSPSRSPAVDMPNDSSFVDNTSNDESTSPHAVDLTNDTLMTSPLSTHDDSWSINDSPVKPSWHSHDGSMEHLSSRSSSLAEYGNSERENRPELVNSASSSPRQQSVHDKPDRQSAHDSPRDQSVHGTSRDQSVHDSPRHQSVHGTFRDQSVHDNPRQQLVHDTLRHQPVHESPDRQSSSPFVPHQSLAFRCSNSQLSVLPRQPSAADQRALSDTQDTGRAANGAHNSGLPVNSQYRYDIAYRFDLMRNPFETFRQEISPLLSESVYYDKNVFAAERLYMHALAFAHQWQGNEGAMDQVHQLLTDANTMFIEATSGKISKRGAEGDGGQIGSRQPSLGQSNMAQRFSGHSIQNPDVHKERAPPDMRNSIESHSGVSRKRPVRAEAEICRSNIQKLQADSRHDQTQKAQTQGTKRSYQQYKKAENRGTSKVVLDESPAAIRDGPSATTRDRSPATTRDDPPVIFIDDSPMYSPETSGYSTDEYDEVSFKQHPKILKKQKIGKAGNSIRTALKVPQDENLPVKASFEEVQAATRERVLKHLKNGTDKKRKSRIEIELDDKLAPDKPSERLNWKDLCKEWRDNRRVKE